MLGNNLADNAFARTSSSGLLPATGMNLLIVDEDPVVRGACGEIATGLGYTTRLAGCWEEARASFDTGLVDIMLLDLKKPSRAGFRRLEETKTLHPETAVVVMSAGATVPSAVEAMRSGAKDLLTKPFTIEELGAVLERAAEHRAVEAESRRLRESLVSQQGFGNLIGRTTEMEKLSRMLAKVAQTSHPVLVLGEAGTGKELLARSIHECGPNATQPFLSVDCASPVPSHTEDELFGHVKGAFPGADHSKEGLLTAAGKGTVFLDEIQGLSLEAQARLVRAMQEKHILPLGTTRLVPVAARFLAATTCNLAAMVEQGRFRKDLFHRLNLVVLRIPPLRERRGDIPLLAAHFLTRFRQPDGSTYQISGAALEMMIAYPWPGNVRELENAIANAAAFTSGPIFNPGDLSTQLITYARDQRSSAPRNDSSSVPFATKLTGPPERSVADSRKKESLLITEIVPLAVQEKMAILTALDCYKGDKLSAAKTLGIGKTTLYRKLKEYGVMDQAAAKTM